jgi:outer membrane protein assembly factor BamB
MKRTLSLTFLSILASSAVNAQKDAAAWPQYRGPNGDGTVATSLGKGWGNSGPKKIWSADVTQGFSSISTDGKLATTLMTREVEGVPSEVCVAMDAATGKELWAATLQPARYDGGGDSGEKGNNGGDGPRSTPSLAGNSVYAITADLKVFCMDAKNGKVQWSKDMVKDFGGKVIKWQNAASPIIENGLCIVGGGGSGQAFVAFDAKSGEVKWKTGSETITHATPTMATIHGVRQVIFFTTSGLTALNPTDGAVLWQQKYPFKTSTAASPVVWEDVVYCSAGYGVGGGAFKITKSGTTFSSEEIWRTEGKNSNHWSTPVVKDGYLYGMFSFKNYGTGPLCCVDIRTGEEKWSQEGFGAGNAVLAGNQILALSDRGELVIVDAKPDGYKEVSRADVLDGKCWSTPTMANGKIFARSTTQAACFQAN